jgi:hypothetical protein
MMHPSRQPQAPHQTPIEPSRSRNGLIIALLVVGLVVDIAAFQVALSLLNTQMTTLAAWGIAIGLGMIAMLLMVEAGHLEAKRRASTAGSHGKGMVRLMISVWFALGVFATMVRTSVAPETGEDPFSAASDPFAGSADPFGGSAAAGSSSIDLGLFTLYSDDMLSALLMLALYTGVGIAAYLFGRNSYDPALTELRRTRRTQRLAQRKLDRLQRRAERASAREAHRLTQQGALSDQHEQAARAEVRRAALDRLVQELDTAQTRREAALAQVAQAEREASESHRRVATAQAHLEVLDDRAQAQHDEAVAHGSSAKQLARHLLHERLADPARTVMDPDLTEPTTWKI